MFKKIYIEITNICNLHCSFCPSTKRKKEFMSLNSFEHILKSIKGYTDYICLHVMGEPLMHPELKQILELSSKYNYKVNLTTNGRLLKDKLDIINNANCIRQVNISLHSYKDESIEEIIDTIKHLNNNFHTSIRLWNLGSDNKHIIDYLWEQFNVSDSYDKYLKDKSIKLGNNLYLNQDIEFEWPDSNKEIISDKGRCYGLKTHIGILVDGTVVPCCLDHEGDISLGNVYNEDLNTILNEIKCKQITEGFKQNTLVESLCKRCRYIERFNKSKN
jgi:radical SAM protein with 4Fe4S-binding SPASM domain